MKRSHSPLNFKPLNDMVYEAIKDKIMNLEYQPGEQLVEQRLAEELNVSKSPIREAFRRLEITGLVYSIPYSGCFVSLLSRKEFKEAFQLRFALEMYCLTEGLHNYTDKDIEQFKKLDTESEKKLKQGNKMASSNIFLSIHNLIIIKAGNELIEQTYMDLMENKLRRYLLLSVDQISSRADLSAIQHRVLTGKITKRDLPAARAALKKHLKSIFNDYLQSKRIAELESASSPESP